MPDQSLIVSTVSRWTNGWTSSVNIVSHPQSHLERRFCFRATCVVNLTFLLRMFCALILTKRKMTLLKNLTNEMLFGFLRKCRRMIFFFFMYYLSPTPCQPPQNSAYIKESGQRTNIDTRYLMVFVFPSNLKDLTESEKNIGGEVDEKKQLSRKKSIEEISLLTVICESTERQWSWREDSWSCPWHAEKLQEWKIISSKLFWGVGHYLLGF